jgi:hypothetical protein
MKVHVVLLPAVLAGGLGACAATTPDRGDGGGAGDRDDHSVVVAGHLYSLYAPSRKFSERGRIGWEAPIEALARDLNRIGPEAVFFLGDSTHDSGDDEWEFVGEKLAGVEADLHFIAGNHEYRDIDRFLAHGGELNGSLVIHGNKYVFLDAKSIFEPHDLVFIERELADHASYDNVFVLMHYPLAASKAPEEEVDPYRPYSGFSNWNRDVVPLIAGKVRYVFCGDLYARIHRGVQHYEGEEIHYVLNSFGFGRGEGMEDTGDGLQTFLELRFEDGDFTIVPHVITLDVKHPWYRHFRNLDP